MKYKTLVLSGGGIKGLIHLGGIQYMEENNLLDIDTYIGTSIGGVIATLLSIDYKAKEIFNFLLHFNLHNTKNMNIINLIDNYGLDDGKSLMFIFEKLLERKINKKDITLGELNKKFNKKIIICVTCLNEYKPYYFSYENYPDLSLLLVIRMTISVPFIFTAVKYNNNLFVDGGLINNYPIDKSQNIETTIGIFLNNTINYIQINNLEEYIFSLFSCLLSRADHNAIKYKKNTININNVNINFTNFNLTQKEKKKLFQIGYISTNKYFINKEIKKNNTD
jgi:NTE family protein